MPVVKGYFVSFITKKDEKWDTRTRTKWIKLALSSADVIIGET